MTHSTRLLTTLVAATTLFASPLFAQDAIVALAKVPAVTPDASVSAAYQVDVSLVLGLKRDEVAARYPKLSTAELDRLMFEVADARSMQRLPATDH